MNRKPQSRNSRLPANNHRKFAGAKSAARPPVSGHGSGPTPEVPSTQAAWLELPFPAWTAGGRLEDFTPNPAWLALFPSHQVPQNPWSGFELTTGARARERIESVLKTRTGHEFDVVLALDQPAGRRWFRLHLAPLDGPAAKPRGWMGLARDITDEHRQLQELREGAEQWQRLAELVDGALWTRSAGQPVQFLATPGAARLVAPTGPNPWSASELDWPVSVHPADRSLLDGAAGALTSGKADQVDLEFRVRVGPKVYRWLETGVRRLRDTPDSSQVVAGRATAPSGRRQLEEALRLSEERFREFALLSNDVFFSVASDGQQILGQPPAFGRISGAETVYPAAAPLEWLNHLLPDERKNAHEQFRRLVRGDVDSVSVESRLRRESDGEIRHVVIRAFLIRDATGQARRINGVVADVTPQKTAENALRASKERLQLAVQGSTDGLYDWDVTAEKVYYSPRWKEMLGYTDSEVSDSLSEWESRLHPADHDRAVTHLREYLDGRRSEFQLESRLRHKDGTYRWILSRGILLRDAHGAPRRMAGSHVDLTREREHQRNVLEVSERERRIIGYDLHDGLGQELTAAEMLVQAILARLPATAAEARQRLAEVGRLVRNSISHVRSLSRGLAPAYTPGFRLLDDLRELAQVAQSASGKICRVAGQNLRPGLEPLVASQLFRIAQEAVNNAIKHAGATRIDLSLHQRDNAVTLEVKDNGCGLPIQDKRHLQIGHGLEVMRYRAHLVGAVLDIISNPNSGTCIRCQLISAS